MAGSPIGVVQRTNLVGGLLVGHLSGDEFPRAGPKL